MKNTSNSEDSDNWKPRKRGVLSGIADAFGIVKDVLVPALTMGMKQNFEQAMNLVEQRIQELQARLLRSLVVWVLVFIAILALAAGGAFLLVDFLGVSRGLAFIAFAGVAFLAAIITYATRPQRRY